MIPNVPESIRKIANSTDRKLAWHFFVFFSRFEYALKRGSYLAAGSGNAEPAWDKFASNYNEKFQAVEDARLKQAIDYFRSSPPRKQVRSDGHLGWSDPLKYTSGPLLVWLLLAVRTVRNNLFHGGKFPGFPVVDPSRDRDLIENAIVVLAHALLLSDSVSQEFHEGLES